MVDYNKFRRKSEKESCERHKFTAMVEDATSFCKARLLRTNKIINVSLMFNSKEFIHETYVYSMHENDLRLGDYIVAGTQTILIVQKIMSVKGEGILDRYKGVVCQHTAEINGTLMPIFVSFNINKAVMTVKTDDVFSNTLSALSYNGDAVMVCSNWKNIQPNQNYLIGDRQWRVVDYDNITNPEIVYVTLQNVLTTMKEVPLVEITDTEEEEPVFDGSVIYAGETYRVATERGFFEANKEVILLERAANYVRIKIPYGINTLEIKVLEYNQETIKAYEVRS